MDTAHIPSGSHSYFVVQSGVQLDVCSDATLQAELLQTQTGTAGSVTSRLHGSPCDSLTPALAVSLLIKQYLPSPRYEQFCLQTILDIRSLRSLLRFWPQFLVLSFTETNTKRWTAIIQTTKLLENVWLDLFLSGHINFCFRF